MNKCISWLERAIACLLVVSLLAPEALAVTTPLPSAPVPPLKLSADPPPSDIDPQAVPTQSGGQTQQAPAAQQNTTPVGTAVAPMVRPEGTAASRPAGAAIAPAKQRRSHTIAIRIALLVGAGVAIGTVTAATLGSPSHPPH